MKQCHDATFLFSSQLIILSIIIFIRNCDADRFGNIVANQLIFVPIFVFHFHILPELPFELSKERVWKEENVDAKCVREIFPLHSFFSRLLMSNWQHFRSSSIALPPTLNNAGKYLQNKCKTQLFDYINVFVNFQRHFFLFELHFKFKLILQLTIHFTNHLQFIDYGV